MFTTYDRIAITVMSVITVVVLGVLLVTTTPATASAPVSEPLALDVIGPAVAVEPATCHSGQLRVPFTATDPSGVRGRSATLTSRDDVAPRAVRTMAVPAVGTNRFTAIVDLRGAIPVAVTMHITDARGNTTVITNPVACP